MTGLISSEKAVLMDNRTVDPEEFLKKIDGVDLILTEGFKHGPWPKIMLHRKENGKPMPLRPEECLAVISDVDVEDCVPVGRCWENGGFFSSVYTAEYATYRKSIVEYETECAWMTGTR